MAKKNDSDTAAAGVAPASLTEKVAGYFAANPKSPEVYSTSDGYLFEIKKFATNHACSIAGHEAPETHINPLAATALPDDGVPEPENDKPPAQ